MSRQAAHIQTPAAATQIQTAATQVFAHDIHDIGIEQLNYTPDGTRLITLDDTESIRIWNATNGRLIREVVAGNGESMAISQDSHLLAVIAYANAADTLEDRRSCLLYDLDDESVEVITLFKFDVGETLWDNMVFTKSRQLIVGLVKYEDDSRRIVLLSTLPTSQNANAQVIINFGNYRVSPNGAFVLFEDDNDRMRVLRTDSQTYIDVPREIEGMPKIYNSGMLHVDDRVYELVDGVYTERPHEIPDDKVAFSLNNSLYIRGILGRTDYYDLCRTSDSSIVFTISSNDSPSLRGIPYSFQFSPDETYVVVEFHNRFVLIDIATQRVSFVFNNAYGIRICPTNSTQVVVMNDDQLISYDLAVRADVDRMGRELVASQTREGDRQQMRHGVGSMILGYLGLSRMVNASTFSVSAMRPPQLPFSMTTRSSTKRKERE